MRLPFPRRAMRPRRAVPDAAAAGPAVLSEADLARKARNDLLVLGAAVQIVLEEQARITAEAPGSRDY